MPFSSLVVNNVVFWLWIMLFYEFYLWSVAANIFYLMHLKFLFLSNLFSYYKHVLFLFWLFHIQLEILKNVSIILLLFLLAFSHFFSFFFLSFLFLLLFSFALFFCFFYFTTLRKLFRIDISANKLSRLVS